MFCDEADGPLGPDHKRFVTMKLEVLRWGCYECELFVSQTPN